MEVEQMLLDLKRYMLTQAVQKIALLELTH
jgi:hypothetical protein